MFRSERMFEDRDWAVSRLLLSLRFESMEGTSLDMHVLNIPG